MNPNKDYFLIEGLSGARKLRGNIAVNGSKNAVLPMMAGALLFDNFVKIGNCPDIEDIKRMSEILAGLSVNVSSLERTQIVIDPSRLSDTKLNIDLSKRLRASIFLVGPLLARQGEASFPHPGGCVIGERPIDLFLDGFAKMGAVVSETDDMYVLRVQGKVLKGAELVFKFQSVGATETFLMAAVLADGVTVLRNCAMEPEVEDLAQFLVKSGAKIAGIGTPTLTIEGRAGKLLRAGDEAYQAIPDRIEAGSFLILGAMAASELKITNCLPEHLSVPIETLRQIGAKIETNADSITVRAVPEGVCQNISAKTHEYPGFPTDLQAPLTVLMTQCCAEGMVFETIYEGRLNYTTDLIRMGADIKLWDAHHITVKGPTPLKGKELEGPDIRAGIAFIIAAIVAEGQSTIRNAYYVDRGYADIEKRLSEIGANIKRVRSEN
ncbi:MAG: UDP-N-acetylglucosamine 1-carboxyvinyltransferase [Candidatus Taylorbacteria bacterium]|nr:UDP-N-acetylglucosamine 1-carboxyvinyltransferase [Candidatus Taylorbacteria bacterium]